MNPASRFIRLWNIAKTVRRYGLDENLESYPGFRIARNLFRFVFGPVRVEADTPRGVRLREALQELGPIFVKFGQIMSTRPDIFPDDIIRELNLLQDRVPPFDGMQARLIVEKSLSCPIKDVFSSFDDKPVASASVAQVHNAVMLNGDEVVVKVLRPGIEAQVNQDIELMYSLARIFMRVWPRAEMYRAVEAVRSYEESIRTGLDLMIEAANASRFRASCEGDNTVYIPRVYWEHTSTDVMVMERVGGIPIRNIDAMKNAGIDLAVVAENGVATFFKQAFHDGYFHGDLHPGNIFVSDSGQFRIVDFGIMGTLTDSDRSYLAENIMAILRRDYRAVAEAHLRAGWAPYDVSIDEFEIGIRTVCEPIFNKPVGEISFGKLLARLFRTAREFGLPMQPQLLLYQKTLLNLEGLSRSLYPELDLWKSARPYLENWMRERYSVHGAVDRMKSESPYWLATVPEIPRLAHDVLSTIRDNQARDRSAPNSRLSIRIEIIYRRAFFALIGSITLFISALNWYKSGFGFWTILLGIIAALCLFAAWPRAPGRN